MLKLFVQPTVTMILLTVYINTIYSELTFNEILLRPRRKRERNGREIPIVEPETRNTASVKFREFLPRNRITPLDHLSSAQRQKQQCRRYIRGGTPSTQLRRARVRSVCERGRRMRSRRWEDAFENVHMSAPTTSAALLIDWQSESEFRGHVRVMHCPR